MLTFELTQFPHYQRSLLDLRNQTAFKEFGRSKIFANFNLNILIILEHPTTSLNKQALRKQDQQSMIRIRKCLDMPKF